MLAVGFDFDHTLGVDNGLERKAFVRLAAELGVPIDLVDGWAAGVVDNCLTQFRAEQISLDEAVDVFHAALITEPMDRATGPLGPRYRDICYALVDELAQPIAGAAELLTALSEAGIRTAILTNGWSPLQQRKIARALGDFPGPILVSDQLGTPKPAENAFQRLADALGCARADVWYVGDNPLVDIAGARAAGMRAAWFDWEGHRYPGDLTTPDATIHRLIDLLPLVRGS